MTDEGIMRLSKNKIDFLAYIPIEGSSEHGQLFMNHELRDSNSILGDGGGMSWLEVKRSMANGSKWEMPTTLILPIWEEPGTIAEGK